MTRNSSIATKPFWNPAELHAMKEYHSTILIVDDEPSDRIFIESSFKAIGVTDPIHAVHNGQEAISYMLGEGKYSDRGTYAYPTFIVRKSTC